MAGMAHSSFPQIGLQFRFFLHVYWYAARGPGMPGLSRRDAKEFLCNNAKKAVAKQKIAAAPCFQAPLCKGSCQPPG
jgi:hypothetical protein